MICNIISRYFDYLTTVIKSSCLIQERRELFPLQILFETEFYDLVPHDENRIADAKKLREDFLKSSQNLPQEIDMIRDMGPANCLEVMVALAERMEFLSNNGDGVDRTGYWFWQMFHNLDLSVETNKDNIELYKAKIQRFVDRQYEPTGHGGLFPIRDVKYLNRPIDATKEELWAQMQAYLMENWYY